MPKEYCPQCGDSEYDGKYCHLCGYPDCYQNDDRDDDDFLEPWELDFDDAVENGLFPMDTEPRKTGKNV